MNLQVNLFKSHSDLYFRIAKSAEYFPFETMYYWSGIKIGQNLLLEKWSYCGCICSVFLNMFYSCSALTAYMWTEFKMPRIEYTLWQLHKFTCCWMLKPPATSDLHFIFKKVVAIVPNKCLKLLEKIRSTLAFSSLLQFVIKIKQ